VQNTAAHHELFLGEEELSDVSLSTFYVFDKENTSTSLLDLKKLPGAADADVAAADAASALADAVGEAVVVVVVVVAAAIAGDVAAGGRRGFLNCPSATMPRSERQAQLVPAVAPILPLTLLALAFPRRLLRCKREIVRAPTIVLVMSWRSVSSDKQTVSPRWRTRPSQVQCTLRY